MNTRLYVFAVAAALQMAFMLIYSGWCELVDYRIQDGLAFKRDLDNGTFKHVLMGHRCMSAGEGLSYALSTSDPCPAAGSCSRLQAFDDLQHDVSGRVVQAFCYTAFPVHCASWEDDGKIQYDTCDRVFPHGFKHFKELLAGD